MHSDTTLYPSRRLTNVPWKGWPILKGNRFHLPSIKFSGEHTVSSLVFRGDKRVSSVDTVDGRNPQTTTWDGVFNAVNNGINYQPQLVSRPDFWTINSISSSLATCGASILPPRSPTFASGTLWHDRSRVFGGEGWIRWRGSHRGGDIPAETNLLKPAGPQPVPKRKGLSSNHPIFRWRLLLVSGSAYLWCLGRWYFLRLFQHTELEHTPSTLYQQAIKGFLS